MWWHRLESWWKMLSLVQTKNSGIQFFFFSLFFFFFFFVNQSILPPSFFHLRAHKKIVFSLLDTCQFLWSFYSHFVWSLKKKKNKITMVLNTWLEHAPVRVFQPKIGDVSHLLCTHLVESDATGFLTLNTLSASWWSSWLAGWILCGWYLLDFSEHL